MIEYPCGCRFETNTQGLPIFNSDIESLPLDCSATWDLICEGNTKGVFQLESQLGRSKSRDTQPKTIEELSDLLAIIRPGCCSQDTKVAVGTYEHTDGKTRYTTKTIKELFLKPPSHIISVDNGKFIKNKLNKVIYSGKKECFRINIRKYSMGKRGWSKSSKCKTMYKIECSDDHKFLTSWGEWVELQYLDIGDRIAVHKKRRNSNRRYQDTVANRHAPEANSVVNAKHSKYYSEICYQTHEEKCVICNWHEANLDTHHIDGNRYQDNSPDNLAFLCPNCHRRHDAGLLSKEDIIKAKENCKLPYQDSDDVEWVTFVGKKSVGIKETYDISMESPYNNFIAGDFIVHNCGDSIVDGKSLTQHYIDRKSGKDEIKYDHPLLEPILKSTYGILVFQEQAMQIARTVAGFSLQQAEILRKAIGKKNIELMAEAKREFLEGAVKEGVFTIHDAEEIFSTIEKSQNYSFNKSHSVSYAFNSYQTAYAKAHFPRAFFTSYLRHANGKVKPFEEVNELVSNARTMDIEVVAPSIIHLNKSFSLIDNKPTFGIVDVKRVGATVYDQIIKHIKKNNYDVSKMTWDEFLMRLGRYVKIDSFVSMISAGVFDCYKVQRDRMLYYLNIFRELKPKHQQFLEQDSSTDFVKGLKNLKKHLQEDPKQTVYIARYIDLVEGCIKSIRKPHYELIDRPAWRAKQERDLLGIEMTCHEVDEFDTTPANCSCSDYIKGFESRSISMAVKIESVREWKIRGGQNKGSKMAFLKISDGSCSIDNVTIFNEEWAKCKKLVKDDAILLLRGTRDENRGSFLVKRVHKLTRCI